MDVKHLDVELDPEDPSKGAYEMTKHVRSNWEWNDVQFRIFTEGITNHLIGVYHKNDPNDMILVRIYGKSTDLFINRKKEREIFKLLNYHGYAPKLYLTFENGMVFEYLPAKVLNMIWCQDIRVYPLVARMMAKIHRINYNENEPSKTAGLWEMFGHFIDLTPETFSNAEKNSSFRKCFPDGKNQLKIELKKLKKILEPLNSPVVLCHNDTILPNVLYDERKHSVTFIDYEYADYNYQAFDIALHFASFTDESQLGPPQYPSEEYQLHWIREYLTEFKSGSSTVTEKNVQQLYEQVHQFIPAANFLYVTWNFMQAELSLIEFDYIRLATDRYEEYSKGSHKSNSITHSD